MTITEPDLITPAPGEESNEAKTSRWKQGGSLLTHSAVLMGFVAMVILFSVLRPETFMTAATLRDILNQAAVPVIIVCGVAFTLSVGQFDLSFPAVMGLTAAIVITLISVQGWPVAIALIVGLVFALLCGLIVSLVIVFGRASSFIVTLALSSAFTGLEMMVSGNQSIYTNIPDSYATIASTDVLGFRLPVWIMLAVIVVSVILLHATRFGRHVYAIGANSNAAYLAGIRIRAVKIGCFVLLAIFAGIAAIVATSKAVSYYPNISGGLLLSSYAALFLGAAMVRSGRFTILGAAMGVVWLLTLQTGLTQLNQPSWLSSVVQGLVLVVAVLLAVRSRSTEAI